LSGSPLLIGLEAQAARDAARCGADPWRPLPTVLAGILPSPARTTPARCDIDIIIPLYRGAIAAQACLRSLQNSCPPGTRFVAIDDGIPEGSLLEWAQRLEASGALVLLRHDRNRGYPAAINTGLGHAGQRDVVLLNSDTLLPPDAIARLADAAYSAVDIGTVTPMTNDGGITTIGTPGTAAPMPSEAQLNAIDARLRLANSGLRIELPSCVGFCVFIRHDCLAETGRFNVDAFAQGYGEENDFSRRAALLGWRHVAACDVAVAHAGGLASAAVRASLLARDLDTLERLHPGYSAFVADFASRNSLRPARRAYDAALWAETRRSSSVILVTHDSGGGVERFVAARAETIREAGQRAIIIRPRAGFAVSDGIPGGSNGDTPNLVFDTIQELAAFLRADKPICVELHHIAAHDPTITRLAGMLRIPFDIYVHDYAAICPRVTLTRPDGTYCGEPPLARDCDDCIADHGARIPFTGTVAAARDFTNGLFRAARLVVVGTHDVATRIVRYMPRVSPAVRGWEIVPERAPPSRRPSRATQDAATHIAIVGGIGPEKGYPVLLACARDAQRRDLPLRFTVIGHTVDDARLFDTGRVFITGPFREGEAATLLREAAPDAGLLPSLWPETWCYALSALLEADLPVTAFALGAQAERLRTCSTATLLPPGTPPAQINDRLLAVARACG
jgi:GT2 family glycosyltransferase/glycosyltransferase involved in cell wall biosynthesis